MNLDNLTKGEIFIVKWQYGLHGSFKKALSDAIKQADVHNLHRLSLAFPDEVAAYSDFSNTDGWWEEVQKKAGIK